jgi:hypothetical protein
MFGYTMSRVNTLTGNLEADAGAYLFDQSQANLDRILADCQHP